ncbi:MAG: hypothetical protein IKD72_09180 [Clostridia bacterium]|nr:hypothetical protein [Clostridia bacterium]
MSVAEFVAIFGEVVTLLGVIVGVMVSVSKVINGQKCLMRTEMLRIYYHNRDREEIRQYELENFIMLYEAYKNLKGNSFIDRIYEEVKKWKVIT